MNKKLFILLFILIFGITDLIAQDLSIFRLELYEKPNKESIGFISLSDIYPLSENPDSLAIPDFRDKEIEAASNYKYFKLDSKYRKRFLSKTKILETDLLYVYDYSSNVLISFTVKNLNIVARLNAYGADWPYSQSDYQLGFEINKKFLSGFEKYFSNTLVYVGKENQFVQGQLKHIVWKKIESKNFPSIPVNLKDTSFLLERQYAVGNAYTYRVDGLDYFIQEFVRNNLVSARRLLVIKLNTKEVVCERIYYDDEGSSLAPLNEQWTGKLFKNKPKVIFGFNYFSFGCPSIVLLDLSENDIQIKCDNRH